MANEKTTVNGLKKAIQSNYDKLDLRLKATEKQAKRAEKQKTCEHYWITVSISTEGTFWHAECNNCQKVFLDGISSRSNKVFKKLHKYIITKIQ